ncbi:MAG: hypothetical protein K9H16_04695 [Bacteroidales bacterium]|nr:hypothetical protein [Bacteroidales bacterium]
MEPEITTKNTKNQILAAYEELLQKVKEHKNEEPKKLQEETRKKEVITKASQNSTESIIVGIGTLKLGVAKELDKLSEQLSSEYSKLEDIQKAIVLEKQNLEELYQLTANTDSLAAMLMAQKEKRTQFEAEMTETKAAFEQEMKIKKEAFEQSMKSEKETFETTMKLQKEQWKVETQKWNEQQKEQKDASEKQRKREEEEYLYNLKLTRKKESDLYEEKKFKLEKELTDKKSAFEKEMAEREANLLASETELQELRNKAASFPKELDATVANTKKTITELLSREFKFEKELTAKQNEGELKLKDQIIATLQSKIKDIETTLKELSAKASLSESTSKEIAMKAIESARQVHIIEKNRDKHEND